MKLEDTICKNYKLVIDEFDIPVAIQIDGNIAFRLYDYVQVLADRCGYVGPGIKNPGFGTIMRIRRNHSEYFFNIFMDNGDFGYVKASKMRILS